MKIDSFMELLVLLHHIKKECRYEILNWVTLSVTVNHESYNVLVTDSDGSQAGVSCLPSTLYSWGYLFKIYH